MKRILNLCVTHLPRNFRSFLKFIEYQTYLELTRYSSFGHRDFLYKIKLSIEIITTYFCDTPPVARLN